MEVLVFKTDVSSYFIGKRLIEELLSLLPVRKVTLDLEDRDRVLRLETASVQASGITAVASKMGIRVEEMTW